MKKLVFTAVVLAVVFGVSNTTNAFWGFPTKANKVEVKNEQAENNMAAVQHAFKGESDVAKLTINKEGEDMKVIIGGLKIKTIADTNGTLTASVSFGTSGPALDLTIKTNADTKVYRRYQDDKQGTILSEVSKIIENDIVSVEGILDKTVSNGFTIVAGKIKDFNVQKKDTKYSGLIKATSINTANQTFKISLSGGGEIEVLVSNSTKITINKDIKVFADLRDGMFVVDASGIVNTNTRKLEANDIKITTRSSVVGKMMYQQVAVVDSVNAEAKTIIVDVAGMKHTVLIGAKMKGEDIKEKDSIYPRGFFKWMLVDSVKTSVKVETFAELGLTSKDKVWVTGELTKTGNVSQVNAYRVEKSFF